MKLQTAKGVRDFGPELKIVRNEIVGTLTTIFELYGFSPLETPILERLDVLAAKYAGGAEILKETFKLKDQGDRDLALRYDLTVPMCRFVGMNPNLKMPFKRYQIGTVFRDGPMKLGRYREFWQCDVDIVGCKDMTADAEILCLSLDVFKRLQLDVIIKVNSRKILDALLRYAGISQDKLETVILSIDKLEKYGIEIVQKELEEKRIAQEAIKKIFEILLLKGSTLEKIEQLSGLLADAEGAQGLEELKDLFSFVKAENVIFDVSLARGLSYYTGTVFEVFTKKGEITSALAGGGRYDKMISSFLNTKQEYPAVGISFGLDVLTDILQQKQAKKTVTKLYIIPINTFNESLAFAETCRNAGIPTEIDLMSRGPSKNLQYANSKNIPYVAFIGEEEIAQQKIKLRDMNSGKEELLTIDLALKLLTT